MVTNFLLTGEAISGKNSSNMKETIQNENYWWWVKKEKFIRS
jgi:hypothetical protein